MKKGKIKAASYSIVTFVVGLSSSWMIDGFAKEISIASIVILLVMASFDAIKYCIDLRTKRLALIAKAKRKRPPRRKKKK